MSQPDHSPMDIKKADRIAGCLLGGAIGDALGGPIEFHSLEKIRKRFGPAGVTSFGDFRTIGIAGAGQITDDSQMTLFTAEGLLRAECRGRERGIADPAAVVYHAYIRWLHTQGERSNYLDFEIDDDGWLIQVLGLHARRAPGNTCLFALRSGIMGTVQHPINQSKGCGGVMRAAPAGLFPLGQDPLQLGMQISAITHGHPSGYLAAGCLAQIVRDLVEGESLEHALNHAILLLKREPSHEECLRALQHALRLYKEDKSVGATPERVELQGEGWVAEEALAIGVYCALEAGNDFAKGIRLAVNHSGDSDSTGSITGNLLGAMLGKDVIPNEWLEQLELRDVIAGVAADLNLGYQDTQAWWDKYPGW